MNKNFLFTLVPLLAFGFGLIFPDLTTTGHNYVSIPAPAFQPSDNTFPYQTNGEEIFNPEGQPTVFYAPVMLPHGVTVTKVIFYFFDDSSDSSDYGFSNLRRNDNAGASLSMSEIMSNNNGNSSNYDDTINYAPIDNAQYSYYLSLYLSSVKVHAYAVIIEYTYPLSLPLILK